MKQKNPGTSKIQLKKNTIVALQPAQAEQVKGGDNYVYLPPAPPKPQTYGCTYLA